LFLSLGASFSIKTAQDYTPVMIASNNGYQEIVKELLERGVDCSIQSNQSLDTALHMAIKNKHKDIVHMLLNPPSVSDLACHDSSGFVTLSLTRSLTASS